MNALRVKSRLLIALPPMVQVRCDAGIPLLALKEQANMHPIASTGAGLLKIFIPR
jgi:hypothetical protein